MHVLGNINPNTVKRYSDYWNGIAPKNDYDYYMRWIFSFMSIHTTWKSNVRGYELFATLPREFTRQQLTDVIDKARIGLIKRRTQSIWEFHQRFWNNPVVWYPQKDETMVQCRNRLALSTYGIGLAKTSFVLEMAFPDKCDVVCLDTHLLQLYSCAKTPSLRLYSEMEGNWIESCKANNLPSAIARHIFWDRLQGRRNTRYWSYVFED